MKESNGSGSFYWNAVDYHKNSPTQQKWAQELIKKLGISGEEHVLDIGCGDGKVTAEIARLVPGGMVTGVDNSRDMIRFASDHFPKTQYPNLAFIMMDARALSYSEEFDVVFSNAALHWISDHKPVLAGIARSLRHGGKMLIQMGGKGNADQVFDVLQDLTETTGWNKYFECFCFSYGFFDSDEYRQWLIEAGLEPLRVDLIPREMIHSSIPDFAAWIRTTWLPWMACIPEKERTGFIDEFIEKYLLKYPVHTDGMIHIPMVRLEVEAKKRG